LDWHILADDDLPVESNSPQKVVVNTLAGLCGECGVEKENGVERGKIYRRREGGTIAFTLKDERMLRKNA
jgi:hypothetical protein